MANIQAYRDKNGTLVSYYIRVHRGRGADGKQLKPFSATFEVNPKWTEEKARKEAEKFAAIFEEKCKSGETSDNRQKFAAYCDYVIDLKEQRGKAKHSTIVRYKDLTTRIYPIIGHIKLKDLRADHLNDLYTQLGKPEARKAQDKAVPRIDLAAYLKERNIKRCEIVSKANLSNPDIAAACRGEKISAEKAKRIAQALEAPYTSLFITEKQIKPLSPKTIIEYHRLISTVLEQAVKEDLIPYNVARKAEPPKLEQKEAQYFQKEEVAAIRDALELEPIKWKTLTHLLLITGCRRGEILGLKWDKVDWENNRIHICNNILYSADIGIYEDTPKTKKSVRYISLPAETMQLLKKYKMWQNSERLRLGQYYTNRKFVFAQDDGSPMHPDSVTNWLDKFSKRHQLPHIHPHAFRHTMASMLYFGGVDSVSISKRLGHAQVSTTANIYAHVMEEADQRNAEIIADIMFKDA